jgi:hypothetical protein
MFSLNLFQGLHKTLKKLKKGKIMEKISIESLFYSGGTIAESEVFENKSGFFALNDKYLFVSNGIKVSVLKYEICDEYCYKILKTKIKISARTNFIEFLKDELFSVHHKAIFKELLERV